VHAAILLYMLVSFAPKTLEAAASAGTPVDVISASEFNQLMKKPDPKALAKPVVEKKAEPKPVEIRDAEVSDLPEVVAPAPQASPPPPSAPPPEASPPEQKKAEPKAAEPKKAEKPPEPVKPDVEALERAAQEKAKAEAAKAEAAKKAAEAAKRREEARKLAEAKKREEQKRAEQERQRLAKLAEQRPEATQPSPDKSKFDSSSIQALLDKRKPRRMAAAGDEVNPTSSAAPAAGNNGPSMTGNDWDRFVARMQQCWSPPDGQDVRNIAVVLRIRMNKDGTLAAEPQLVERGNGGSFQVAADAALRAVKGCAPYTFMPVAKYEHWKDFEINFDPKKMNRG
jgi:colicin import membrane protein